MNKQAMKSRNYRHDALIRYARMLGFGEIHVKLDQESGLHSIIAIHNTNRGPAIGGCRLNTYVSHAHALKDVLRLSYMMTLKSAASDLPHGGAKAVIIKPPVIKDREALFHAFGNFVDEMNGSYITAMDVGTTTQDMDIIAQHTPHVIGAAGTDINQEDPSPYTADGIYHSLRAAVQFKLNRDNLDGLTIAMQGAGKVSYYLAKHLHKDGMNIIVCDIRPEAAQRFADEFNAKVVAVEEIYDQPCDIFAPCALGGTLKLETINRLNTDIIVGSANNQLAHRKYGKLLHDKGVLYAPDFIVNAGGLIQAASIHDYQDIKIANNLIKKLYDRMMTLFERSASTNLPTMDVAEQIALEKLNHPSVNATITEQAG